MKDALGHGSEAGAHSSGVTAAVPTFRKEIVSPTYSRYHPDDPQWLMRFMHELHVKETKK